MPRGKIGKLFEPSLNPPIDRIFAKPILKIRATRIYDEVATLCDHLDISRWPPAHEKYTPHLSSPTQGKMEAIEKERQTAGHTYMK